MLPVPVLKALLEHHLTAGQNAKGTTTVPITKFVDSTVAEILAMGLVTTYLIHNAGLSIAGQFVPDIKEAVLLVIMEEIAPKFMKEKLCNLPRRGNQSQVKTSWTDHQKRKRTLSRLVFPSLVELMLNASPEQ